MKHSEESKLIIPDMTKGWEWLCYLVDCRGIECRDCYFNKLPKVL